MKNYIGNLFGLLLALSLCQTASAQGGISPSDVPYSGLGAGNLFNLRSDLNATQSGQAYAQSLYARVDGNPYMLDGFQEGVIVTYRNEEIVGVKLNYDGYQGNVIAINQHGDKIALDEKFYKKIIITGVEGNIVFGKPELKGNFNHNKNDKFFQVLYDNNGIVFYKDLSITIRKSQKTGIGDTPDRFVARNSYYVKKDGNAPIAVNLRKKDLFDHFEETEMAAINKIVKKKKNKLRNEADYVALFSEL